MKVVLLAGSEQEAIAYARAAQIPTRDFIMPRSGANLRGLRLESTDLIAQFYSFINHPQREEICAELRHVMAKSEGGPPRWERIGQ